MAWIDRPSFDFGYALLSWITGWFGWAYFNVCSVPILWAAGDRDLGKIHFCIGSLIGGFNYLDEKLPGLLLLVNYSLLPNSMSRASAIDLKKMSSLDVMANLLLDLECLECCPFMTLLDIKHDLEIMLIM
ncbi:hypothetical protein ACLOJK_014768 [Asimina triloba]